MPVVCLFLVGEIEHDCMVVSSPMPQVKVIKSTIMILQNPFHLSLSSAAFGDLRPHRVFIGNDGKTPWHRNNALENSFSRIDP